jgi:integrase
VSAEAPSTRHVGIVVKHRANCASRSSGRCNCRRIYQAAVWSARDAKRIRKHFDTLVDAKLWRADSYGRLRRRQMRPASKMSFAEAAERWLVGARLGTVLNRSGDVYKPSTIRSYELALRGPRDGDGGLIGELGRLRLTDVSIEDVQSYVDRMLAVGAQPSTIHNAIMPVRVIYRWRRREVVANPTDGLVLPAVRQSRVQIVSPAQAELLLAALKARDRPLWATAMYAGLRRGELMALRWTDVDLAGGVIEVKRAWDPKEHRMVAPKSAAGARRVPVAAALRAPLALTQQVVSPHPDRLVFGSGDVPFSATTAGERARRAWHRHGLVPIGLHDCRHTFASLMIAAGVNAKALSTFMGHANISITLDRYGHLMPGAEDEAAGLLDAYLTAARTANS